MNDETLPPRSQSFRPVGKPSVSVQVALELGIKPSTAEDWIGPSEKGLSYRTATVIRILRRGDHIERLAQFWEPIFAGYEDRPLPRTIRQLRHKAQVADVSEDLAESLVMDSGSVTNLLRWERELRDEAALGLELAEAVGLRAQELKDQAEGCTV